MAEFFDLYDANGTPTGVRKRRELVHRDGDWHRSIALWIVRRDGRLVLQRRSTAKDTRPGLLTASVSGHYAAGEGLGDVLREAREEIGVAASLDALLPLGTWRFDDVPAPGTIDRELQDVFLWPLDLSLASFNPDRAEVAGLAEVWPRDVLALARGQATTIPGVYRPAGGTRETTVALAVAEFVPPWRFHRRVAQAALEVAAGRTPGMRHGALDDFKDWSSSCRINYS